MQLVFSRSRWPASFLAFTFAMASVYQLTCGVFHCAPPAEIASAPEAGCPGHGEGSQEPAPDEAPSACCVSLPLSVESAAAAGTALTSRPALLLPVAVRPVVAFDLAPSRTHATHVASRPPGPPGALTLPLRI